MVYVRNASGICGAAGVGLALPHLPPVGGLGCGDARGAALPCVRRSGVILGNGATRGLGHG